MSTINAYMQDCCPAESLCLVNWAALLQVEAVIMRYAVLPRPARKTGLECSYCSTAQDRQSSVDCAVRPVTLRGAEQVAGCWLAPMHSCWILYLLAWLSSDLAVR